MRFLSMIRCEETGQIPSEKLMQDMGKLIEEMIRDGNLITTGGLRPSSEGVRVRWRFGELSRTDGPFTETKEVIGGYAMLEARSMREAIALTERFLSLHGTEWNLECEIRPLEGEEFQAGK
jgi:hypothetical protein